MKMYRRTKFPGVVLVSIGCLLGQVSVGAPQAVRAPRADRAGRAVHAANLDAVAIIGAQDSAALKLPDVSGAVLWKDPAQPTDARVQDLISRMSLAEKASQLMADAPALPRLGIPAYSYRNECLHGVVTASNAVTVFPQAIGMA